MILVNGDSVTWGCELTENDDDMDYINKHRYSSLLSATNISKIYNTNERIVWDTIEYIEKYGKPDFVIIQWANTARFEWYSKQKKKWMKISARHVSTEFKKDSDMRDAGYAWFRDIETKEFREMNFWRHVHHLESYLGDIPHYFYLAKGNASYRWSKLKKMRKKCFFEEHSKWKNMLDYTEIVGDKEKNPDNYCQGQKSWIGRAYGQHLSEKGHQVMANFLNEHII